MVDLSVPSEGELGGEHFFSDLFQHAVRSKFTGGVRVRAPQDMAVFFRAGVPIHAGGVGFTKHHLGEVLVRSGAVDPALLVGALERQNKAGADRLMLGRVLEDLGVTRAKIEAAMGAQIESRVQELFAAIGTWQSAPGENDRVREMAVECKTRGLLLLGLRTHAPEPELRAISDQLLGKAVALQGSPPDLPFDENETKILKYLDKPRKVDQLERAVSRRVVRALLRVLSMHDKLKMVPASQAIPIAKATKVVAPTTGDPSATAPPSMSSSSSSSEVIEIRVPEPTAKPPPKGAINDPQLMAEVRAMHKELKNKNYFELIGVKPETATADLRKAFTVLAKKYHPDAFVAPVDEEFARVVREVSAKLNEAYQTLSNDKARAEYMTLLGNSHIRGDAQKADMIKDAEMKYQKGIILIRRKDFPGAREYLTQAVSQYPESGEYKAALGWSIFADPKFDRDEALTKSHALLTQAIEAGKPSSQTLYYMGQVCKARSEFESALKYFQKAFALNDKLVDAEREIRLLKNRKTKGSEASTDASPGFLSKLLNKPKS